MTPRFDFAYVWLDKVNNLYIVDAPENDSTPIFLYTNDIRHAKLFGTQGESFNYKLEKASGEAWDLLAVNVGPR